MTRGKVTTGWSSPAIHRRALIYRRDQRTLGGRQLAEERQHTCTMEAGGTAFLWQMKILECLGEEISHGRLRAEWGFMQHLGGSQEEQGVEM